MLEKKKFVIPFVGGIDTKTDAAVLLPDRLSKLVNGEFTKHGKVRMRPGLAATSEALVPSTATVPAAFAGSIIYGERKGVATRGTELLLATDNKIYTYAGTDDRWIERATYYPMTHTAEEVAHVNAAQTYPTVATAGGIRVVAWSDSRVANSVRFTIYDAHTGAAIRADSQITNATRPTCVPLAEVGVVLLLWADTATNDVKGYRIYSADPFSVTQATYLSDLSAARTYAVTTDGTDVYFAYDSDGSVVAAGAAAARVNASASLTSWKKSIVPSVPACIDVAIDGDLSDLHVVFWVSAGTTVRCFPISTGGTIGASLTYVQANVVAVAAGPHRPEIGIGTDPIVAYEVSGASNDLNTVVIRGTNGTNSTIQHAHLVSTGFSLPGYRAGFILGHDSRTGLQNSYYVYDDGARLCGQLHFQTAADKPATAHMARVWVDGDTLETALGFKRKLDAEGTNGVFTHDGISRVVFNKAAKPQYVDVGGTTYLTGSMLFAYDGQFVTEANVCMWPDMQAADAAAGTSAVVSTARGLTDNADYSYRVYYVATRANGEKIRSNAIAITKNSGAGGGVAKDAAITLTIPTLGHSLWNSVLDASAGKTPTDIVIEVFRTVGNDTSGLYYKVSGTDPSDIVGENRFLYNSMTATTVTFLDEMSDAEILSKEVDYLSRGEIEHTPIPAPAVLASAGNRIFAAGGAVPEHQVYYSKLRFPGEAAQFSDLLSIDDLPAYDGPVTALSNINETLVVFKERGIAAIAGTGTDNTGTSGGYQTQPLTADLGCSGASVVMPQGVMFASSKGIYLLDQSFGVQYIGAPVEAYNSQTYTGAIVIPGQNQVLFLTNSGYSVMFDYTFQQWSPWSVLADSVVVWDDTYAVLRSADGRVLYSDPDVNTDGGSPYTFTMRTGAVRVDETIQGWARLWRFQVSGTYKSSHRLKTGILYNREETPYEEITWDPSTTVSTGTWGSGATWGSDSYWGGALEGSTYQFEHVPKRQKFATLQFEFTALSHTMGAAFELSELVLYVGVKQGLQKHSAARKY